MTLSTSDFGALHAAVHGGKPPFAWQQRLLEQIVRDKAWPHVLDLPTGAGKTTCIDIGLFALALDATNEGAERWCPRRIAMVVDRRIVVDQVAERGRSILRALMTSTDPIVVEVATRLRSLTRTGEEPLGVFTLRGGMPKDDGWARTPDQPLVIASTVDQVYNALYRPDLVREKLAGDPGGKVRSAAPRLDLDKVVASGSPPKIRILSPDSASRAAPETVTVEAELADQGGGIGKVEWRVNGAHSIVAGLAKKMEPGYGGGWVPSIPVREAYAKSDLVRSYV